MICRICQSEAQAVFPADIRLYMNRPRTISHPPLNPAPDISVCLDCGFAEFVVAPRWLAAGWLASLRQTAAATPHPQTTPELSLSN